MENIITIITDLFGSPPTSEIERLYYVFGLILLLMVFRVAFSFIKAILGIKN